MRSSARYRFRSATPPTSVLSGNVERASTGSRFSRPPASNSSNGTPHGSIFAWHWAQPGWLRCRSSRSRSESRLRLFLERGHVRRRIVRRFGDDPAREPRPALHRVRLAAVRQPRQDRRLGEHAAQFAPAVRGSARIGTRSRSGRRDRNSWRRLRSRRRSPTRSGSAPAGCCGSGIATNCTGSCRSCVRGVAGELGEPLAVRFEHLELVECQPLRGELAGESCETRVGDHPRDLGIQLLRQRAGRGQFQQSRDPAGRSTGSTTASTPARSRRAARRPGVLLFSIRNRNCGDVSTTCSASFTLS